MTKQSIPAFKKGLKIKSNYKLRDLRRVEILTNHQTTLYQTTSYL